MDTWPITFTSYYLASWQETRLEANCEFHTRGGYKERATVAVRVDDARLAQSYEPNMMKRHLIEELLRKLKNDVLDKGGDPMARPVVASGALKQALVKVKAQKTLYVIPRLHEWYTQPEQAMNEDVAEKLKQLVMTPQRDRSASFSPSGLGTCERKQVFKFHGMPQQGEPDSDLMNLFADGTWRHLRLQTTLLSAGIIEEVEVAMRLPEKRFMGHADGLGKHDEHGAWLLEVKGANERSFAFVMSRDKPLDNHLIQGAGYCLGLGIDVMVFLYECKNTQRLKEFVVDYTSPEYIDYMLAAEKTLDRLNAAIDTKTLPPKTTNTKECPKCPFVNVCDDATWQTMEDLSGVFAPRKVRKPKKKSNSTVKKRSIPEENLPWRLRNPGS